MNDLDLKKRILENPVTTVLALVLAAAAVVTVPGDWRTNTLAACVAIAGALMKDPKFPSGGNPV